VTSEFHAPTRIDAPTERFRALARRHYENFPVGSWLVPRAQRIHMHRLYAFARTGDDLADEHGDREGLAALGVQLDAHLAGARDIPFLIDLASTVRDRRLDPDLLRDLLSAFEQHLDGRRYPDEAALMDYCRRSADPVGRLVLQIFDVRDPSLLPWSDRICTGLQLVNHLQDMGEDYRQRDRIYFPLADLARFDVTDVAVLGGRETPPGLRRFALAWCDRLAADFATAWPLTGRVPGRLSWELRAILRGAGAVLDCIRRANGDILGQPVRLSKWRRLSILVAALTRRSAPAAFSRAHP